MLDFMQAPDMDVPSAHGTIGPLTMTQATASLQAIAHNQYMHLAVCTFTH